MFCKWCGKKLLNNSSACPSCGKSQTTLENGNGFWDLCGKENSNHTEYIEKNTSVPQDKNGTIPAKISPKNNLLSIIQVVLHIAVFALFLYAVIGIKTEQEKMEYYLSEYTNIRTDLFELGNLIDSGFEKISKQRITDSLPTDIPFSNENNKDTSIWIEDLLESNQLYLIETSKLHIERYEIASENANNANVFYVTSDIDNFLSNENVKTYWQKHNETEDTWETIAENTRYIVMGSSEKATYRVVCLVDFDANAASPQIGCFTKTTFAPILSLEIGIDESVEIPEIPEILEVPDKQEESTGTTAEQDNNTVQDSLPEQTEESSATTDQYTELEKVDD